MHDSPVFLPVQCPYLPLALSTSKKHMAPARADCCPSATLPRRDWLKLGHSLPLPASDWLKLGHSLRPQFSPCHCRVTAWLEGEGEGGKHKGRGLIVWISVSTENHLFYCNILQSRGKKI